MIQKAFGLDKARPNDEKMNSLPDTPARELFTLAKKTSVAEENNAKGKVCVLCQRG
jgi:hypothetical protein